jgi:hypothetical protein
MTLEEHLSASLARTLDQLEVPAGDVGAARRAGERQRRQRRWTTGLAAAAALAVVATGVGLALRSGEDEQLDPAPSMGSWTRLPDAPISPRTGGIAVWTGTEAIFLGGEIDHLCPPTADCKEAPTYARDGAAYDPVAGTWRTIAPAPVAVVAYFPHAVVGDNLVLVDKDGSWHAYDASEDQWRGLPAMPDSPADPAPLSETGGRVYALGRGDEVQVLDLSTATWSTLPASPHAPRIDVQNVIATPEGIVVTGVDSTVENDGTVPSWLFAEVYDGNSWRRLERSDMVDGWGWSWTGERLVSPTSDCVDGGETNPYPRCIPQGGILDPGTGTWGELPDAPEFDENVWGITADGGPLVTRFGRVYDDSTGKWMGLPPRPKDAPDYDIAGVWADGTLIAFGGLDSSIGWTKDALSNQAWSWTP